MMVWKAVNERIQRLDNMINEAQGALKDAPEGSLQIWRSEKRTQYYHYTDSDNRPQGNDAVPNRKKTARYIGRGHEDTIRRLIQKDYEQQVLRSAMEERAFLIKMADRYPDRKPEDVYKELDELRRNQVKPLCQTDEEFAVAWQNRAYRPRPFRDDDTFYYSDRGEKVRSKSEVIIANQLNAAGIPYLYECPLTMSDGTILHPDFTVLKVRERRTYIWEHLGMMDDASYCQKALSRIHLLESEGYFPGENLILTHETSRSPLDIRLLKKMMHCYLI